MSSKPKHAKTYIMHQNGNFGQRTCIGRYKVGAKNEKEAEKFLREVIGKHTKVRVYYEEKENPVPHGTVMSDPAGDVLRT